jgi:hypothetical protein
MAITLNQLVQNILRDVYGGSISDDRSLSKRQIAFKINGVRATLLERRDRRGIFVPDECIQDLGIVPVKEYDSSEHGTKESREDIVRTIEPIPTTVRLSDPLSLTVFEPDKLDPIPFAEPITARFSTHLPYTASIKRAFRRGDHIYVVNKEGITSINVRGVFWDPIEAIVYNLKHDLKGAGKVLIEDLWDLPYPIAGDMEPILYEMVFKQLVPSKQQPIDNDNDGKDDSGR